MKRIANVWLAMIFLLGAAAMNSPAQTTTAPDQPLGDYARAVKKEKNPTAKTFDNDNLPMQDKLNVVGSSATATASNGQQAASNPAIGDSGGNSSTAADKADSKALPTVTPGESAEDRQKVYGQWQDKLAEQKVKVESLSHDIDALQREYKQRLAEVYYGDPAARARNDIGADKQAADFKKELDEKQKALNDAKQDMDSIQEDARKAGVPESVRENAQEEQK